MTLSPVAIIRWYFNSLCGKTRTNAHARNDKSRIEIIRLIILAKLKYRITITLDSLGMQLDDDWHFFFEPTNEYKLVTNPAKNKFNQRISNLKVCIMQHFLLFFCCCCKVSLCVFVGICWNAFKRWNWRQNQSRHSTDIKVKWFIGRRVNCLEIMETYRIHIFLLLTQFFFVCILRVEISLVTVKLSMATVAHYHTQTQ